MRSLSYRDFSRKIQQANIGPSVCQFELTFACGLRCRHCYSDCFNRPRYIKREMGLGEAKFVLDKVRSSGVLWLCFTGGDPILRRDFAKLYAYAKDKGFLISIFTSGYSINNEIISLLKKRPPFSIEITLNASREYLFEKISRVKGSFKLVMRGINLILKAKLPLKIKTQVTKDNLNEVPRIEKLVGDLGLRFRPNAFLHARLNGDTLPANLRISPQEVLRLNNGKKLLNDNCKSVLQAKAPSDPITPLSLKALRADSGSKGRPAGLFSCVVKDGGGFNIDPYGNIFLCNCIRNPRISLLKEDILSARERILKWARTRSFGRYSGCQKCRLRSYCYNCPGKALLEKKDLQGRIDWFCKLAHLSFESGLKQKK